ncbi:hypothetical protein ACEQUB_02605 [Ralstonia syzygii]
MLIKHLPTDQPDDSHLPSQARRQWLSRLARAGAGTVILSLAGPQIVFGANIVAVRVWPAQDYTRVTIESDTALSATHQLVADPDRLVVDIDGLDLNPSAARAGGQDHVERSVHPPGARGPGTGRAWCAWCST